MPTSSTRHPSRDALLRDALGQLKEQRGVSLERFARTLNILAHAMCPAKTEDMACLASFTEVSEEYDHAVMSWNKRVQRWASGAVEFPAWLEEPWMTALEELGDTENRVELVRRHGFLGVRRPQAGETPACAFAALGAVSREAGEMMGSYTGLLEDGVLDEQDAAAAPEVMKDIDNAIAALMGTRELIKQRVVKPSLKVVGD
ncbi:hypothetical protein RSO41_06060 [Halomonas sp. I1]|uniref:hypothetical protein n=1 Tax=Halomonas sp. I1 TaxID=393536 RepID=UPI0028DEEDFC|nr:hypothetical protein [Halomonas sp. I1]MDT8894214.1 hypothetical protein [Halomonas sp. I1]